MNKIDYDMPEAKYRAIDALSQSGFPSLYRSPMHYQDYIERGITETEAMRKGSLVDCLLLDGEHKDKICEVEGVWRGQIKEFVESKIKEGCLVCKPKELNIARAIVKSVKENKGAVEIINNTDHQVSLFSNKNEVQLKGRCDMLNIDYGWLYDLKVVSTDLSNLSLVAKKIQEMKIHWQLFFYKYLVEQNVMAKIEKLGILFVESSRPYGVRVFEINEASIDLAEHQILPLLEMYKVCKKSNMWPGYQQEHELTGVPDWAFSIEGY